MEKINVVVVGTGMYVSGRGTDGYGTIMPAVFEHSRSGRVGDIIVVGHSANGTAMAKAKIKKLKTIMGVTHPVKFLFDKRPGSKAYKSAFKDISRPACAIIAVPDRLHKEVAMESMRSVLHTLVVKPLVPTCKDARELIECQGKENLYCAVEFHKRYDEANLKLRDTIENGGIGEPLYFAAEFSQRKSIPSKIFKSWVRDTNIFQYLGVHYADIIYFSTGARPVRAMALGQKLWLRQRGIDAYDAIEAVIEWRNVGNGKRFVSSILTNWIDPESTTAMSDQRIKVIGTKGRYESDQKNRGIKIVTDEKGAEEPNPYFNFSCGKKGAVRYTGYGVESITRFICDASDVASGKVASGELEGKRPTFKDALVSTAIVEAVNSSLLRNGAWINVKGC